MEKEITITQDKQNHREEGSVMMGEKIPTRQEALDLLHQYNESDSLRKHAYAVEGVMRYMARKRGENEEKWGIVGLIHDLDYERFPD